MQMQGSVYCYFLSPCFVSFVAPPPPPPPPFLNVSTLSWVHLLCVFHVMTVLEIRMNLKRGEKQKSHFFFFLMNTLDISLFFNKLFLWQQKFQYYIYVYSKAAYTYMDLYIPTERLNMNVCIATGLLASLCPTRVRLEVMQRRLRIVQVL